MGKGDIRTRRGKISNSSYGVKRPQKKKLCIGCGVFLSNTNLNNKIQNHENKLSQVVKKQSFSIKDRPTKQMCYNCLKEYDNAEITREHIPAKNLFEGYDEKYKPEFDIINSLILT